MPNRPNILLILNDDMGYSDLGCYGGEVRTPNLDGLADGGLRFTQAYNTARCCPSRASLLTGLHPHQTGVGHMTGDQGFDGYRGDLNGRCVTIAEALRPAGYATYMSGKWHISREVNTPQPSWPLQRGFDRFHGTITGCGNYFAPITLTDGNTRLEPPRDFGYYTDVVSDTACRFLDEHAATRPDTPFFQYVAYTAPHWPLHALPEDIARYEHRFDAGWDVLREQRIERMIRMGILDEHWALSPRDPDVPRWDDAEHQDWEARRMAVYAAQIDRMDQGIGRIVETLRRTGQLDNTLILFLADNGGCAEELVGWDWLVHNLVRRDTCDGREIVIGNRPDLMPGGEETYQSYGLPWANVSNTPFRLYKHWVHEGGIATPLIAHWPAGFRARGELRHQPLQLPDILATCLDVAGAEYPTEREGVPVHPLEGFSIRPCFDDAPNAREALFWEHEGNRAVRRSEWKLVRRFPGQWELYHMPTDRTELHDRANDHPELVRDLAALWQDWADRCGVLPWETVTQRKR